MFMIKTMALVFWVICMAGCVADTNRVGAYECNEVMHSYLMTSRKLDAAIFNAYDLEKRYAIYMCGNQYVHPPMLELAEIFATGGGGVAVFLIGKLSTSDDDLVIRDIAAVFSEMQRLGTYDVVNNWDLMDLLRSRVHAMKHKDWRQMVERKLDRLERWKPRTEITQ